MNIKDKVKKLLSLATSPNENEARAALLKAKKLMAENKLTEEDLEEARSTEMVHLASEEVSWTTDSGNIWMVELAEVIARNYLCTTAWQTPYRTRTHQLVVTGLGDDARVCMAAIEYATGFVLGQIKLLQRRMKQSDPASVAKSYAVGFISGLVTAFEEQQDEHPEWGLVMVEPEEVADYRDSLGHRNIRAKKTSFDPLAHLRGFNDGMEFNDRKALGNKPIDN